jgi:hypothetical protein
MEPIQTLTDRSLSQQGEAERGSQAERERAEIRRRSRRAAAARIPATRTWAQRTSFSRIEGLLIDVSVEPAAMQLRLLTTEQSKGFGHAGEAVKAKFACSATSPGLFRTVPTFWNSPFSKAAGNGGFSCLQK